MKRIRGQSERKKENTNKKYINHVNYFNIIFQLYRKILVTHLINIILSPYTNQ